MNAQKSQVKPPLVSIITATYNDETYIESSIRSVLSQDFTDFEYLIINDGSTDNTKKIVQRLQKEDSRIRLINQKNSGLVASLNRGITEARGTYIARIDGDDEWLPHKLKTQVTMLEKNKNLVLVGGGAEIMKPRWWRRCPPVSSPGFDRIGNDSLLFYEKKWGKWAN